MGSATGNPFFTARQLQELLRDTGRVLLPYRARLTPAAQDWLRARKGEVGYGESAAPVVAAMPAKTAPVHQAQPGPASAGAISCCGTSSGAPVGDGGPVTPAPAGPATPAPAGPATPAPAGRWRWWCEGPCGPAKAALVAMERERLIAEMEPGARERELAAAVWNLADFVKAGGAGGVLVVRTGAAAMALVNRCPRLRGVLGTSLAAVEAGVEQLAANVLVLEHPGLSLMQCRNLLSRFIRGRRAISDELQRQLAEVATCA